MGEEWTVFGELKEDSPIGSELYSAYTLSHSVDAAVSNFEKSFGKPPARQFKFKLVGMVGPIPPAKQKDRRGANDARTIVEDHFGSASFYEGEGDSRSEQQETGQTDSGEVQ